MNIRSFGLAILTSLPIIMASSADAFAASPEGEAEGSASGSVSLGGGLGGDADADADVSGDTEVAAPDPAPAASGGGGGDAKVKDRGDIPWIKRWAPEPHMGEVSIYGGAFFPSKTHELFQPSFDLPDQGFKELKPVLFDIGLRGGYYPMRFFGVEFEGGVMPAPLAEGSGEALLYHLRGSLVGQLGLWSVTPFVLIGAGGLGVASPRSVLGQDIDPAMHFGGGVKVFINRNLALRLDIRDNISYQQDVTNVFKAHNPEVLLSATLTLGRKKDEKPSDRDGDGLIDSKDSCPDEAETFNEYKDEDGCPESDRDGDGFWDDQDSCPDEAETFNDYLDDDGCPESDRDGDGFWDDKDSCPDEAETVNGFKDDDGCPEADPDNDGFFDEQDSCPNEPESENGYQDGDGCPDEVPAAVQAFTGTIKGITFENDSDKIRKSSTKTLDAAVAVLKEHGEIKIKIDGHTDDKGDRDHNMDLSKRRAESVKKYMVDNGIDESRIKTEGFGPDKPIDDNKTSKGRANNRRIEFQIITRAAK